MSNDEGKTAAPVEGVTDAPGSELDEPTAEELIQLARDRKLSKENQRLRQSRNEAWGFLGVKTLEEFEAFKAKRAAEPEPSDEPEPAPASNGAAKDAAIWKLVARVRSVDPDTLADVLNQAVTGVSEAGECLDSDGLAIEPATVRAALPRFCAATTTGGSGGRQPAPLVSPPTKPDPIESAVGSQKFYEAHKAEVLAAEKAAR